MKQWLCAFALLTGCNFIGGGIKGSGTIVTSPRQVGAFSQVDLGSVIDAEIRNGPQPKIELVGDDNLLPLIKTEVHGDKLEITTSGHESIHPSKHMVAKIELPQLAGLEVSGTGDARLDNVACDKVRIAISGTGDVLGTGHASQLAADISGTGELKLAQFPVEQAAIDVSGTGDADIAVSQRLDAHISGTGDITYHGNPPSVTKHVSGTGSLHQK